MEACVHTSTMLFCFITVFIFCVLRPEILAAVLILSVLGFSFFCVLPLECYRRCCVEWNTMHHDASDPGPLVNNKERTWKTGNRVLQIKAGDAVVLLLFLFSHALLLLLWFCVFSLFVSFRALCSLSEKLRRVLLSFFYFFTTGISRTVIVLCLCMFFFSFSTVFNGSFPYILVVRCNFMI